MFTEAFLFLLNTLLGLFTIAVLLRFYLQLTGAPYYNPVSQAVVTATNFLVRPFRRFTPSWRSLDLSTLVLAFIAQLIIQLAQLWAEDYPLGLANINVYFAIFGLVILALFKLSVHIFVYAVIIQAIMSWVSPYNGTTDALNSLTAPLLNPIRRMIGNLGGLDISPLIVFIVAQLIFMLVIAPLERVLMSML
ncbi:MAG TPA: YggT family protein [Methylophilaceae bacterium]